MYSLSSIKLLFLQYCICRNALLKVPFNELLLDDWDRIRRELPEKTIPCHLNIAKLQVGRGELKKWRRSRTTFQVIRSLVIVFQLNWSQHQGHSFAGHETRKMPKKYELKTTYYSSESKLLPFLSYFSFFFFISLKMQRPSLCHTLQQLDLHIVLK